MSARARLGIDAALVAAFLVSYNFAVTGLYLHEWLSVGLAAVAMFHLALNWDWVTHTVESFLARLLRMSAVNLVVDVLLFAATVMAVLSGLVISRVIGPLVGLSPSTAPLWHRLHSFSGTSVVTLFAVHGVLHWKWILRVLTKWLSDGRAGSREENAKKNRGGSGRHRSHGPRHVGRGDRRHRSFAEGWDQDGFQQDRDDFEPTGVPSDGMRFDELPRRTGAASANQRRTGIAAAEQSAAEQSAAERGPRRRDDMPTQRLHVHVLSRDTQTAAVGERGRSQRRGSQRRG